jgi:hypothetical protein
MRIMGYVIIAIYYSSTVYFAVIGVNGLGSDA